MLSCGDLLRVEHEKAFVQLEEPDDRDGAEEDNLDESEEADEYCNIEFFSTVEDAVKELHSFSIQRCGSHSQALAISDACDENSTTVLDGARRVVKKLRTAKLLVEKGLSKVILDVTMRWGSTFDMLDCLLNLKSACIDLAGIILGFIFFPMLGMQ